jgi:hypothetical protein
MDANNAREIETLARQFDDCHAPEAIDHGRDSSIHLGAKPVPARKAVADRGAVP